jgi:elongation factor 2
MKKLWGDNYFDPETQKWTEEPITQSGKPLKRAFVQYIMDPICTLSNYVLQSDK